MSQTETNTDRRADIAQRYEENPEAVEEMAERDDHIGALARAAIQYAEGDYEE